jgi:oxygen-independent coproporphyrinogen-3 oxidase
LPAKVAKIKPHLAGIYIHIPFCRQKCRYCDFYSTAVAAQKDPVLKALHRELALRRGEVGEPVRTLYFGGGTPSVCAPEELQGLIDRVKSLYDTDFEEVTVEANPDDLTDDWLAGLKETAVDRLSIGIQSFHDAHLQLFNRRHTGRQGVEAVERAQKHGFQNITIDLIYGIPGMTDAQWESNLHTAIGLGAEHLSAYHLTIEPRTVFGRRAAQGKLATVPDETSARQYEILERLTAAAGYDHYEVSNFARPSRRAIHNGNYWNGTPYLGIGPAAHSFDGKAVRRWNTADNRAYVEGLETGDYFETERLTEADRFNETLMTRLRTSDGASWNELERTFGPDRIAPLRTAARKYLATGLLVDDGERLRIPSARFLVSDAVIADLFWG